MFPKGFKMEFPKLTIKIIKYVYEPIEPTGSNYNPFKKEWVNLKKRKNSI